MIRIFTRTLVLAGSVLFSSNLAVAQMASLDELIEKIREDRLVEDSEAGERLARFASKRDLQAKLLQEAKDELAEAQKRSLELKLRFDANELALKQLESQRTDEMEALGEVFGSFRQMAGDLRSQLESSITTAQDASHLKSVSLIAEAKSLPTIDVLETLWYELQRETVESGRISKFQAPVLKANGETATQSVLKLGNFMAFSDGKFLRYSQEDAVLREFSQPMPKSLTQVMLSYESSSEDFATALVDPVAASGGSLLAIYARKPDYRERVEQGGLVGYIILGVGALGLLIAMERFVGLSLSLHHLRRTAKEPVASDHNPLGRIVKVYQNYNTSEATTETLELKLDEAVMKEIPRFERGLSILKVLAATAPLLGLLGTVVGMIGTFQAITLFGTGDPKLMAGGISEALVTTMLGLIVAIPLLLAHSILNGISQQNIQIIDEQSIGLIAEHSEKQNNSNVA